ncbi:MAG: helix-turn-helix transcriptional regulator [Anaerolineae bacterium]|nr:helix-turn-helix transcriptional regulator [Anaerolineae bacterium]
MENCPTRRVLDRIADKWTVLVIVLLRDEPRRFSELHRAIEGISQKMLTQTLRSLERDGLVDRTVYAQVPPRVDYNLTDLGQTLGGLILEICNWAETHIGEVTAAQLVYDERHAANQSVEVFTSKR